MHVCKSFFTSIYASSSFLHEEGPSVISCNFSSILKSLKIKPTFQILLLITKMWANFFPTNKCIFLVNFLKMEWIGNYSAKAIKNWILWLFLSWKSNDQYKLIPLEKWIIFKFHFISNVISGPSIHTYMFLGSHNFFNWKKKIHIYTLFAELSFTMVGFCTVMF